MSLENIVASCAPCNRRKGDKLAQQMGMALRARAAQPEPADLHPRRHADRPGGLAPVPAGRRVARLRAGSRSTHGRADARDRPAFESAAPVCFHIGTRERGWSYANRQNVRDSGGDRPLGRCWLDPLGGIQPASPSAPGAGSRPSGLPLFLPGTGRRSSQVVVRRAPRRRRPPRPGPGGASGGMSWAGSDAFSWRESAHGEEILHQKPRRAPPARGCGASWMTYDHQGPHPTQSGSPVDPADPSMPAVRRPLQPAPAAALDTTAHQPPASTRRRPRYPPAPRAGPRAQRRSM